MEPDHESILGNAMMHLHLQSKGENREQGAPSELSQPTYGVTFAGNQLRSCHDQRGAT